jgi:hypothetical protein
MLVPELLEQLLHALVARPGVIQVLGEQLGG